MQFKYPTERYPRITVIMPVLNSAATVEKSLLSLAEQNYPNLEFIVLDGGSGDGTLDVIGKYKSMISYMRSHKDKGNAAAINEGIEKSTGVIINQLNADDFYEAGTLIQVGEAFIDNPALEIVSVLGRMVSLDASGELITGHITTPEMMGVIKGNLRALHPNCRFFRKDLFDRYGKIIETIDGKPTLASDYEYLTRFSLYEPQFKTLNFIGYNYLAHEKSLTYNTNKYTKLINYDQKIYYIEQLLQHHQHVMTPEIIANLKRQYEIAFPRRVVKNLLDGESKKFMINFKIGISKFGPVFPLKVLRYWFSYTLRLNKRVRAFQKKYLKAVFKKQESY